MRSTDAEKTLDKIEKMPIEEKHKAIFEIQKKGFQYQNKEIVEIIKDKWAFLKKDEETDIENIDYIIFEWAKAEELRKEIEEAESGNPVIDRYFKKYGTLSKKDKLRDGYLHSQTVYFDGKATPGDTWNTELFMYRLGVYKTSYNYGSIDVVQFYADMNTEDLMDAKMSGNMPTLRHCHNWYTNPHKNSINHYSHEEWLKDIEIAKKSFIKEIKKMIKDCETIRYNSQKDIYIVPEKYVLWFYEKADHNGDETTFMKSEIYGTKYKIPYLKPGSVPKKYDKIISHEEMLQIADKYCEDKFKKHNFRKNFKY